MTSTCSLPGANVLSMPSLAEGTQQLWYAQDVDDSLEVVGQAREAEFSANVLEPLHEEIALIIGVFESTKWVLNDLLSLLHDRRVGFEPLLHALEDVLIDPAGNPSTIFVSGALLLNGTAPACRGGIVADMAAQLGRFTSKGQLLSCRTPVAVLFRVIGEALLAKESQLGVG
jgi:hypothetical protein